MLTPEERLMIGLKFLERFKPNLQSRRSNRHRNTAPTPTASEVDNDGTESAVETEAATTNTEEPSRSLQAIVDQIRPFAPSSLILGSCEDGVPFVLDLSNPAPGAILIAGESGSGKTRLIRSILASVCALNSPAQVSYSLIARDLDEYEGAVAGANCQEALTPEDSAVDDLIRALGAAVEQRRYGSIRGPAMILAIDDLASFLQYSGHEGLSLLYAILKHGPRSQIWTLATLNPDDADQIDERLLAAFRTRLVGSISDPMMASYLANDANSGAEELISGSQFSVPFGEEWIRFWVCSEI